MAGGCHAHRPASGATNYPVPSEQLGNPSELQGSNSSSVNIPIQTTYSRPLAGSYGDAYALAHQQREQVNEQVRLQQVAFMNIKNTIQVILWSKVCPFLDYLIPSLSVKIEKFFGSHLQCYFSV